MYKYTPREPTEHLQGIPARDLTDNEFAALSPFAQDDAVRSGMYAFVEDESSPRRGRTTRKTADDADTKLLMLNDIEHKVREGDTVLGGPPSVSTEEGE